MNSKNEISIIIPVYNVDKYIDICMNSILNQTFKNIEVILIDDGSTDLSGTICDRYARIDKRIFVKHIKNSGASVARNEGIKIASGKYICFVDADDYIEICMYKKMYEIAEKYNADIVICGINLENFRRQIIEKVVDEIQVLDELCIRQNIVPILCKDTVLYNSPCNKLYNSYLIKEKDIKFPIGLKRAEDLQFNRLIIPNTRKIILIPDILYHYNLLNYSATASQIQDYHKVYLDEENNTINYINKYELNTDENFNDLNKFVVINIIREIVYDCSTAVYKSIFDSKKAILDLGKSERIRENIRISLLRKNSKYVHRQILKQINNGNTFIPLFYGIFVGRLIWPLKRILRTLVKRILKRGIT